MDLDQLAKYNYFVKHNDQIGAFEVLRADRAGSVTPVQTNIRTESKAQRACKEWHGREMVRMIDEIVNLMAGVMRVELERQQEEGRSTADLKLMAAAGLAGLQIYIQNNAPASTKN